MREVQLNLYNNKGEYGIVCNVSEDKVLKEGSKVWLIGGTGGEGDKKFVFLGRSLGGRMIKKWKVLDNFKDFRCVWIPDHIRKRSLGDLYISGDKETITKYAIRLNYMSKARADWKRRSSLNL